MKNADNDDIVPHHPNAMQTAVAIAYQTGETAPKVVAKGKGLIAEQIILRAQENGVYVHQSKELVSLLMQIDLDDRIPPNLYRAVAELLAWLYHIETELSQRTYTDKPPPTF
jgi:flagellar biosynthesis protein